ncbi:MAG: S41 family peptidase [Pseudomonadales bacterium]
MNLRPLTLIGIVISMVTGIALGITGFRTWLDQPRSSADGRTFEEVLDHVSANYVSEVDRDDLVLGALKGMLGELDDHSLFLDTGDYRDLQADTSGQFGGVGIELGISDGYFTVIAPIDGTPAERAGLQAGDRIVAIDGETLRGRKLIEVVERLRGTPGSSVTLNIGAPEPAREVTLTRATIELASVTARLLEPGFGYVRISQFQVGTGPAFDAALDELRAGSPGGLRGLILDLRDNPGGVLQASVAVADALLDQGMIVYTEGRLPSSRHTYRASAGDAMRAAPVVVLMNRGSASAAEIVAGALQDHGRARVMGSTSYGKGSVQSVVPVSGNKAIKLTTAYYFTPSGRSIHQTGIDPDLPNERTDESRADYDARLIADALALLKQDSGDRLHARL